MIYRPSDWLDTHLSIYCYRLRYWLDLRMRWQDWYPAVLEATEGAYGRLNLCDVRRLEPLKGIINERPLVLGGADRSKFTSIVFHLCGIAHQFCRVALRKVPNEAIDGKD